MERSFAKQFQIYGPMVYRRSLNLLGSPSEAEDAVQDIFLKAHHQSPQWDSQKLTTAWLYRVTTNHCLNILRNRKRRLRLLKEKVAPVHPRQALSSAEHITLLQLLENAEPRQAQAAVYVYIDGMSQAESAQLMEVSVRTIANLLSRFNQWAKEQLRHPGEERAS